MPGSTAGNLAILFWLPVYVVLPGLVLGRLAGLRGWPAVCCAPLLSYGITAVVGPVAGVLGVRWSPWLLALGTALPAALLWVVDRRRAAAGVRSGPGGPAWPRVRGELLVAAGIAAGTLVAGWVVLNAAGSLAGIHQGWDSSFHANAIRFIAESGRADPGALGAINNYEDPAFYYPNALHSLAALGLTVSGATLPAVLNAQMLLLVPIAGLGLAVLVRAHGGGIALAASVPVVLAAFTDFAYGLMVRGPLLPFATGLALAPAFLVLVGIVLDRPRPATVLLLAVAGAGLVGVQPGTAVTAGIFAVALVAQRWWLRPPGIGRELAILGGTAGLVAALSGPALLGILSVGDPGEVVIDWPAALSPGRAVGDLLLLRLDGGATPYLLLVLLIAGLAGYRRLAALRWWLATIVPFGGLFVLSAATDARWTNVVTQPWWNDRWRFAAILALILSVPAAYGAVRAGSALAGLAGRLGQVRSTAGARRFAPGLAAAITLVLLGGLTTYADEHVRLVATFYGDGPNVSAAERTAMAELASTAAPGVWVMNDPGDGSAWMYALAGLRPVFGHVVNPANRYDLGADQRRLLISFRCLDTDPAVQSLVEQYGIGYVFVGQSFLREGFTRAPGLTDLGEVRALSLQYANSDALVYRVDLTAVSSGTRPLDGCVSQPVGSVYPGA